jgi:GntR family transcriptional regulator
VLKQQIVSGELRDQERLPTQEELCVQYGVSRITVRRALADLQAEGLIRNEQGVGAFVTSSRQPMRKAPSLSFVAGLREVVETTTVQVLSLGLSRCPRYIADALGLGDEDEALHVVRVRYHKNVPVMLNDAWLPKRFEDVVTAHSLSREPLFKLITRDGKDVGRVIQEVNAEIADLATASALRVELNSPVLRIDRLMHNRKQSAVQYLSIRSCPLRTRLLMEVAGNDVNTLNAGHLLHDR